MSNTDKSNEQVTKAQAVTGFNGGLAVQGSTALAKSSRGGKRPGSGRPKKADEERIRGQLGRAITKHYGSFEAGIMALLKSNEPTLVKWVFERYAGKPTDRSPVDAAKKPGGFIVQVVQQNVTKTDGNES